MNRKDKRYVDAVSRNMMNIGPNSVTRKTQRKYKDMKMTTLREVLGIRKGDTTWDKELTKRFSIKSVELATSPPVYNIT